MFGVMRLGCRLVQVTQLGAYQGQALALDTIEYFSHEAALDGIGLAHKKG
jgi:hypothetical protein